MTSDDGLGTGLFVLACSLAGGLLGAVTGACLASSQSDKDACSCLEDGFHLGKDIVTDLSSKKGPKWKQDKQPTYAMVSKTHILYIKVGGIVN